MPNAISNGQSLPTVQVLMNGLLLEQFDTTGTSLGESFTNNPAWVLLDVLRRSGWLTTDVDLPSFATAAAYCAAPIDDDGSVRECDVGVAIRMQSGDCRTGRARRKWRKGSAIASSLDAELRARRVADAAGREYAGAAAADAAGWDAIARRR